MITYRWSGAPPLHMKGARRRRQRRRAPQSTATCGVTCQRPIRPLGPPAEAPSPANTMDRSRGALCPGAMCTYPPAGPGARGGVGAHRPSADYGGASRAAAALRRRANSAPAAGRPKTPDLGARAHATRPAAPPGSGAGLCAVRLRVCSMVRWGLEPCRCGRADRLAESHGRAACVLGQRAGSRPFSGCRGIEPPEQCERRTPPGSGWPGSGLGGRSARRPFIGSAATPA